MNNNESIKFKFKSNKVFNIISFFLFILLILIIIVIFKNVDNTLSKILYLLLTFIIINILMIFIGKKVSVIKGVFIFDSKKLIYENYSSEYTISYNEIQSITRDIYIDDSGFLNTQNYVYKINIKNSGYFIFKYYDDSLLEALKVLSLKSNIKIDEIN